MKAKALVIALLLMTVICPFSNWAIETNLIPWHVVSSNRLAEIRQEFHILPRPVIASWKTVTRRGPVMFFGWSAEMEGSKLVLTTNAAAFIRGTVAKGANEMRGEAELAGALWPMLLDTNHSGEATATLIAMHDNAYTVDTDAFLHTGYLSPTNRGAWDVDGPHVRQWLRYSLCRELWLDVYGAPAAVPGGKISSSSYNVDFTDCTDLAATPP